MVEFSESLGWIAAICGALSLGSFGVPVKYVSKQIQVNPLVLQTYKSIVCFLTCWLVLLVGVELRFTFWGILSGLFWVPGATAGIYAIQHAGLAISYGVWCSLIVVTSFCWGIFAFHESVKSVSGALLGALVLVAGLIGMARYSAPSSNVSDRRESWPTSSSFSSQVTEPLLADNDDLELGTVISKEDDSEGKNGIARRSKTASSVIKVPPPSSFSSNARSISSTDINPSLEETPLMPIPSDVKTNEDEALKTMKDTEVIHLYGTIFVTRRELGILCAVINGVWGGMKLVPMHFARSQGIYGITYLISYASGSMIVTILMWVILYLYYLRRFQYSHHDAVKALPSFHIPVLVVPGLLSGCLYSLGNVGAIIAISVLGQSVGFSCVQLSLLVSGLWGIFIFGEVQGIEKIWKWLLSSVITIGGIVMLGLQHQKMH